MKDQPPLRPAYWIAYRAVYTVRLVKSVYVLHVCQKKSKKGVQTPKHVIDLIRHRLRTAERHDRER